MLDDVVMASEGVVDAVERERDVGQRVDVRAVLVNDDIIKNWIHQSIESHDIIESIHNTEHHVRFLNDGVTMLDRIHLHDKVFLRKDFVLFDDLKVVAVHTWHDHVTFLWLLLEVQGEALVFRQCLVQEWISTREAHVRCVVCKTNDSIDLLEHIIVSLDSIDLAECEILRRQIAKLERILRNIALNVAMSHISHRLDE